MTGPGTWRQERAKFALHAIERIATEIDNDKKKAEARSYAKQLPALLRLNGLGQVLAMARAEPKSVENRLASVIAEWLRKAGQPYANATDVLAALVDGGQQKYFLAQAEAMMLAEWLKSLALAYIPAPPKRGGRDAGRTAEVSDRAGS